MAKWSHDDVMDGAADIIQNNANLQLACTAQPTDRADALAIALADIAMAPGDFTHGDDGAGRKLTVTAKNGVLIDVSGTATHVALIDATRLLYVTLCTSQALVANGVNTVDFPSYAITKIGQPT